MLREIYYCDKCGREMQPDNHIFVTVMIDGDFQSFVKDYCPDCAELFIKEIVKQGWREITNECDGD